MRNFALAAIAMGAISTVASAGLLDEVEPNDTLATGQDIGALSGAVAIIGNLGVNDVDFYCFTLGANTLFTANVFDFTPDDDFDNDSIIALLDAEGNEIEFDDDDGPGFLSSLSVAIETAGTYYLAMSGFGDNDFVGDHDENFTYKLILNSTIIPGPASLAGLAGLLILSRRRRRTA